MQMKRAFLMGAAIALLGAIAPASAAGSAMGRISYIYPDGHRLILDAEKTHSLAPSVNTRTIGVAEFVNLTVGPNGVVTAISPGPPDLAAYWAPRDTRQS